LGSTNDGAEFLDLAVESAPTGLATPAVESSAGAA